jgi:hypothetical protein
MLLVPESELVDSPLISQIHSGTENSELVGKPVVKTFWGAKEVSGLIDSFKIHRYKAVLI